MATIVEYGEDPNIKALRESILSVGQSVAGGIARNREQQNRLVMEAQKRAHETYITQMGIQSREKISREGLEAQKERNKVLDRQHKETHDLSKKRYQLNKDKFEDEKDQREIDAEAAGGYEFMMNSYLDWKYDDNGNLAPSATPDQIKVNTQLISKSKEIRTKWAQSKLGLKEIKDTIKARMMAINGLLQYDAGEQTAQLKAILQGAGVTMENGRVDPSQLARFVHSKEMYDRLIHAGIVTPSTTTKPQWAAQREDDFAKARGELLKNDNTSWLSGPYIAGHTGQRQAVIAWQTASKSVDSFSKNTNMKDRPDALDILSVLEKGTNFTDSSRRDIATDAVFSNFKPFMQNSGLILTNPSQLKAHIKQSMVPIFDQLEANIKGASGLTNDAGSTAIHDSLIEGKADAKLAEYGIKALKNFSENPTNTKSFVGVGAHYLRQMLQGDVADTYNIRPSQRLFAHIVSNKKGLKGMHITQHLDSNSKEAKEKTKIFTSGTRQIALTQAVQLLNVMDLPEDTGPKTEEASYTQKETVDEEALNTIHRNWPGVSGLATIKDINKDLPTQIQLDPSEMGQVSNWYQMLEDTLSEKGLGAGASVGVMRNDNIYNLEGENGINIAVQRILATPQGRKELASAKEQPKRRTGAATTERAVEKFHTAYVTRMINNDPVLSGMFEHAKGLTGRSPVDVKYMKGILTSEKHPASVKERFKFFHQALGGNERAWELFAIIYNAHYGSGHR